MGCALAGETADAMEFFPARGMRVPRNVPAVVSTADHREAAPATLHPDVSPAANEMVVEHLLLESYRRHLLHVARQHLQPRMQAKVDLSDVVQETLLDAHRAGQQLRTGDARELGGWLRRALLANLADQVRRYKTAKRDVRRECALAASSDRSPVCPADDLVAADRSPVQEAIHREELQVLAEAIQRLLPDQQKVLRLHYSEGRSLKEVAQDLGRSTEAVAGLLYRATKKLRARLARET